MGCGSLPVDDVDAVDARDREQAPSRPTANAHLVLMARLARDVHPPPMLVDCRACAAACAVVDLDIGQGACVGRDGVERAASRSEQEAAHRRSSTLQGREV